MSYIAKAFVRIKEDSKRNEVVKTLERIGYECLYGGSVGDNVIVIKEGMMAIDYAMPCDCINCLEYANGDEEKAIELFLELAKIKNEVTMDSYVEFNCDILRGFELYANEGDICRVEGLLYNDNCFKVLTPLELAEAFKQGKINLK